MVSVFLDLIGWLRIAGVPLEDNAALAALQSAACWRLILSELKPADGDRQFMTLLREVTENLDSGRRAKVTAT